MPRYFFRDECFEKHFQTETEEQMNVKPDHYTVPLSYGGSLFREVSIMLKALKRAKGSKDVPLADF